MCAKNLSLSRRRILQALGAFTSTAWFDLGTMLAASGARLDDPVPFSFETLRKRASELAKSPYRPTREKSPGLLESIDYDTYQKIRFRRSEALWAGDSESMPVELFHLGRYARRPVAIHVVEDGRARRVRYSPDMFEYGDPELADRLPRDLGFAGFRALYPGAAEGDWLVFMGASYFRSAGAFDQYGLSARGIAVDTSAPGRQEQFPYFTSLWLEQPKQEDNLLTVYALLDGESLTGAYRFECRKEDAVTTDVRAELFQRRNVAQLGVAPLTSMYWYSETNHRLGTDWRPEIHDSDGLALWTGDGERIWRPLNAPPHVQTNAFMDRNPKGFGLLQRDRNFDHYHDDGVFYDRRPSVWVEPKGDWGGGAIYIVEMPTDDEIHDNIVTFWVPERSATKGSRWRFDYRLQWVATEPYLPTVGRVVATRIGRSGIPGQHEERLPNGRKFVIDLTGGPLSELEQRYDLDVVAETSRGRVENQHALMVVGTDLWRVSFDLIVDGSEPVDLRCHLRLGDRTLTETWIYQYIPGNHGLQL